MGIFVVFEGPDGAGKTTQVARLERALGQRGLAVLATREPGGTPVGDALRDLMLGNASVHMQPLTWAFLMNAARAELVREVIRPALGHVDVIIADRYWYSTVAYQGSGEGVSQDLIEELSQVATDNLTPDLVVYLRVPAASGLDRKRSSGLNVLDRRPLDFHVRVGEAYDGMADANREKWLTLDGLKSADSLSETILQRVLALVEPCQEAVASS